jgi:isopenicillin N synthase-like dioxygenase
MSSPDPSTTNLSRLPVLDFSLVSSPSTKPLFLSQLRHALVHVGFLYLSNHSVPATIVDTYVSYIPKLYALPQEEKDKISMMNSPHFHGYVGLATEFEPGLPKPNYRELFDFATRCETKWKEGGEEEGIPDHWKTFGPAQVREVLHFASSCTDIRFRQCKWPDDTLIPGFREAAEQYFDKVTELSYTFVSLIAEALGLPPDGFAKFFEKPEEIQHRVRTLKYPILTGLDANDLGTVPHQDVGFVTIVCSFSSQPSPLLSLMSQKSSSKLLLTPSSK